MMKCVFALVVLWHLCYSTKSLNMTLNKEMIDRLEILNKLYKGNKVNISSPYWYVPKMQQHSSSCVGVIITKLEHLLDNVTVHKDNENILPELKANMQELKANMPEFKANLTAPKENHNCSMLKVTHQKSTFKQYANFLKKLNMSLD